LSNSNRAGASSNNNLVPINPNQNNGLMQSKSAVGLNNNGKIPSINYRNGLAGTGSHVKNT
jgi:hypothetical protein